MTSTRFYNHPIMLVFVSDGYPVYGVDNLPASTRVAIQ